VNEPEKHPSHVQSVARALQLLEVLARENREVTLTEIAEKMKWPKSTTHGLLATLRDYRFVDQSPISGRYHLGVRLFELGHLVAKSWDIRSVALPQMQRLNQEYGEMVQLATEEHGECLYIEKLESRHFMHIVSEAGARLPMHCSALGKMLLAHKSASEVKWILDRNGMERFTRRTITDVKQMEKELAKIREQGHSVDDREIMDGLRCIAAPIFDKEGVARYAISISSFADTLVGEYLERVLKSLKEAAREISSSMGFPQQEGAPAKKARR
jgi:DNA-binding IclR family transcriptional regulator